MPSTLLLDQSQWDLVVNASGNIAVAAEPYALAQDAASAIRTFEGECFWDTSVGVPYLSQILGKVVPLSLLKQALIEAALTVPNVVSAQVFVSSVTDRTLQGQVQVASASGRVSEPTSFVAINPQGAG
jgi:hypothetical protein